MFAYVNTEKIFTGGISESPLIRKMIAYSLSAMIGSILQTPFETIKIKMILDQNYKSKEMDSITYI